MTRRGLLWLGMGCYGLFLSMFLPARVVYDMFEDDLSRSLPMVQIEGVGGTLWHGSAASVRYRQREVGRLSWDLSVLSLLGGKLGAGFALQTEQGYLNGDVSASFWGDAVTVNSLQGQLPVAEVQRLFPYYPVMMDALLAINIPALELSSSGKLNYVDGQIDVHSATLVAPQHVKLGDYRVMLTTSDDGQLSAVTKSLQGPLSLDGNASLGVDGRYSLSGKVSPSASATKEASQLLGLLGKADREGAYHFSLNGRI